MINFKKNLANNITLIVLLMFTLIHILVLTLSVTGAIKINLYEGFNYFVAYLLIIISLILYIFGFFIEKITKLTIPSWFEIVFYVAFFLFTNTYYIINAYTNVVAVVFLFAYLSFLVTIANISVFYHTQKDENNKLHVTKNYILTSIFFYSAGTNAVLELFITFVKHLAFPEFELTTVGAVVLELSTMLLTSVILTLILNLSLLKSKRLINACLIKTKK